MRLTAFKAKGFKSFCEQVAFKVDNSLTGIVGPNGCGKSNILDAIRWVLGESTASMLRGSLLVDVLFNGTQKHEAADWCFVELEFDNSKSLGGELWSQYPTIIVRRELARDGNQKYSINNKTVRRRDVIDLFHGTGATPRSYSVVEQGMIGDLAEANSDKLRAYLEEAAGVSHYKDRRKSTEARFRSSEENLQNLDLIIDGLEKQGRSLQRQIYTFNSHQKLTATIRTLQATLLTTKKQTNQNALTEWQDKEGQQQQTIEQCDKNLEDIKNQLQECTQQSHHLTEQLEAAREVLSVAKTQSEKAQYDLQNVEKIRHLHKERLEVYEADKNELTNQLNAVAAEKDTLEQQQVELSQQVENQQQQSMQCDEEIALLQTAAEDAHSKFEVCQQQKNNIERLLESEQVRQQLLNEQVAKLNTQIQQFESEIKNRESLINKFDKTAPEALNQLQLGLFALDETIATLESQLKTTTAEKQTQESTLHELEKELAGLETEITALSKLERPQFEAAKELKHITEVVQVQAGEWSRALDAALGVYATALAVSNIDEFVKQKGVPPVGNAIVEHNPPSLSSTTTANNAINLPLLLSLINMDADKVAVLQHWMAGVYAAQSLEEAMGQRGNLQANERIVTQDGTVLTRYSMMVYGEVAGGFDWQERVKTLTATRTDKNQLYVECQNALTHLTKQFNQLQTQHKNALAQRESESQQLTESKISWNRELERQQAIKEQQAAAVATLHSLCDEQQVLQDSTRKIADNLADFNARYQKMQDDFTTTQQQRDSSQEAVAQKRSEAEEALIALQQSQQQCQQIEQQLVYAENQIADYNNRLQNLQKEKNKHANELQGIDDSTLKIKLTESQAVVSDKQEAFDVIDIELKKTTTVREQLEAKKETTAQEKEREKEQLNNILFEIHNISTELNRNAEDIAALQLTDEDKQRLAEKLNEQTLEAEITNQINTAQNKLNHLGPVNFAAQSELQKINEDKTQLEAQKADVLTAISELRSAINRIDKETEVRMQAMFDGINQQFPPFFQKFFGGGHAQLEMSDASILEADFEIKSQLPGKRQLSARMLSGGEKAALALSFLFSIIKLNPPPFCVLDEVDAPLDDTRSHLFASILADMVSDVQCIVVSHNKGTISTLPRLIGVTQEEAGISRVVTVTLGEALRVATN